MGANGKGTPLGQPVPDLPVADIERAQQHYRVWRRVMVRTRGPAVGASIMFRTFLKRPKVASLGRR